MKICTHIAVLPLLLLTVIAQGQLSTTDSVSPSSVNFGNVTVGTSTTTSLTITNTGSVMLNIYALSPSPPPSFGIQNTSCFAIQPKKKCTYTLTFTPSAVGSASGSLVISSNASSGTPCTVNTTQGWCLTVPLTGNGTSTVTLLPASISFGSVNIGSTSSSQTIKLTDNGRKSIIGITIAASTSFLVSSTNCSSTLSGSGAHCNINVAFRPTTSGLTNGTLAVNYTDNNTGFASSQTSALSGSGVAVLQSITVTPANAGMPKGSTQQYTATGNYNDGSHQVLTAVTWRSTNTAAATINVMGLATAVSAGNANITATSGTIVGSTPLTVTPATLQSITVTPANASFQAGSTPQQYTATGKYSDGTQQNITSTVTWASSNTATATVSSGGLVSFVAQGNTSIAATSGAVMGSTPLAVTLPTLQSITVTPPNATLIAPTTQQYTATANYSDGSHTDVTTSTSFSLVNAAPATATITTGGLLSTGVAGGSTVYATYNNVIGQTAVTVTATQTGISVKPPMATMNTGDSQQFTAYATLSDGTTGTTPLTATWSATAGIQVDVNGLVVADQPGQQYLVTATEGIFQNQAIVNVNTGIGCLTNNRVDMKLLVITRGRTEASFPAITSALNYLHMPYDVFDFSNNNNLSASQLSNGCHAFYSGVIFAYFESDQFDPVNNTYNGLDFSTTPATVVPFNGFNNLQAFEGQLGIRQLNWFAYPAPAIGFNWPTGSQEGDMATINAPAAAMFSYLATQTITIDPNAFVNLTTPSSSGLVVLNDSASNALSLDYQFIDNSNREFLSNTFDSNQYMRHNIMLSYGLINWVAKGIFVGQKHILFTPQEDDWGIDDDIWAQNTGNYLTIQGMSPPAVGSYPACTNPINTVTGMAYRISASDAQAFLNWQTSLQQVPLFANVKLYNAFNSCGLGITDPNCGSNGSPYPNDTLTAWTQNPANSSHFGWINHTYEHEDLTVQDNGTTPQTYAVDYFQINQNILNEANLGFADFNSNDMVTPDISGLDYLPALQAMVDNGVQYVVSDTSCGTEKTPNPTCFQGTNNGPGPGFNLPVVNSNDPISPGTTGVGTSTGNIYEVPRRPSNLFYNVGTPDGWQNEYDCVYTDLGGTDPNGKAYGQYTVQDIKDFISGKLGVYPNFVDLMMQGDADPEMFHQTNLTSYDGTNSVLSDLLSQSFNLYQSYFNLPVQSMSLDQLAQFMLNNQAVDNSGVVGTVNNGSTRTVTLTVTNPATIPVTGLGNTVGGTTEQYGAQFISHVPLTAGEILTQPVP